MTEQASITCPRCGMTSYHPKDVEEGYCGNCHDWTAVPAEINQADLKASMARHPASRQFRPKPVQE